MRHSFVTIAIPFDQGRAAAVAAEIDLFETPAGAAIAAQLDRAEFVHFMSMHVIEGGARERAHLLIEATADGGPAYACERLAAILGDVLLRALGEARVAADAATLPRLLQRHRITVGQGWVSVPGLDFDGTPGFSVKRILDEWRLAKKIAEILDRDGPFRTPRHALEHARARLWSDHAEKWAFVPEPAPFLAGRPDAAKHLGSIVWSAIVTLLWPFVLLPLLGIAITWLFATLGTALWVGVLLVAAEVALGLCAYARLRHKEETDIPDDEPPSAAAVEAMMRRESFGAQNLLAAASVRKPGSLRWFTLRSGLWGATLARFLSRPGYLGHLGVIHFARWILLPGTGKLLFFSNYDGALESYLEDFIEREPVGVTAIWSNTEGFPRSRNLFMDGCRDGDRLRRWTRRQMFPPRFWYSAYPPLTLARIRANAAIRQGLAGAATEAEAADWLACFGSGPRAHSIIESDQVPTLVFSGLRKLPHAACLFLRLAEDSAEAKAWLAAIEPDVAFGERSDPGEALVVGFTAHGLARLGVEPHQLSTFPVPFQHGSDAPWRARALGDVGPDAPEEWWWGGPKNRVDAVLTLYAASAERLGAIVAARKQQYERHGHALVYELPLAPLPANGEPVKEPFGYADGISQPIIRGTRRAARRADHHQAVEPGEFILGYPDNLGYFPPTPTVPARDDPDKLLPAAAHAEGQRPNFAAPLSDDDRDLGRNGTFLVVRQLEQHTRAFEQFLDQEAARLAAAGRGPSRDPAAVKEWLGAKIVGRWKDGSSLVRHPNRPRPDPQAPPDNDFLFGTEDPSGLRCPFGAHVRRANPRESFDPGEKTQLTITNRHRILRVGRSYSDGEGPNARRGLAFMCLNVDIERQFEFVQQTWLLAPSFHGLENEVDAILGHRGPGDTMTIPTASGPLRVEGLKKFVTVRGAGYFFLPGRRALRFLARRPPRAA